MKKITLKDIAEMAGVTKGAVSVALNNKSGNFRVSQETREKILKIAGEHGYRINTHAKGLSLKKTYNIGYAIYDILYLQFTGCAIMQAGAALVTCEHNYNLSLCTTAEEEGPGYNMSFIKKALEGSLDGVIIMDDAVSEESILKMKDLGLPIVLINRRIPGCNIPTVTADCYSGFYQLTEHLIKLGHVNIRLIFPEIKRLEWYQIKERINGYRDAMRSNGYELLELVRYTDIASGIDDLLKSDNPPTALVCFDESEAIHIIEYLQSRGMNVPRDISVTGFEDDKIFIPTVPALTTIQNDMLTIGMEAAKSIFELIDNGSVSNPEKVIETRLLARNSTGPVCKG